MGSVARAVVHRCERPVLVARAPTHSLHDVIVATDGSEHATKALEFTRRLPLPVAAQKSVLHVVRPYKPVPDFLYIDREEHERTLAEIHKKQEGLGADVLADAKDRLLADGPAVETVLRAGDPAAEILRLADEQEADLIIAGARGVSWIEGLFLGSVAERLLKTARCSVLIVH
jgi:nucleotide-binding universal stress UspA family protein